MITAWLSDLRTALRSLLRTPGFTLAAVATLALGLAAFVSVGTWIYAALVRPLPGVGNPDLVVVAPSERLALDDEGELSLAEVEALRASDAFAGVAGLIGRNLTLTGTQEPERVAGASIEPNFLSLVGVRMFLGRDFRADEGRTFGFEEVAILSHGLWLRRFGGDRGVIGKSLEVNQRELSIVGVLPPGFALPDAQALYLPWAPAPDLDRGAAMLWTLAAPRPGAALEAGQARVDAVFAALAAQAPPALRERGARLLSLRAGLVDGHGRRLSNVLLAVVAAVLLVACANVAMLQLARGAARRGEMELRRALGAGRWHRMRPLLAQSLCLAVAGTLAGLALGRALFALAIASLEEELPTWMSFELDGTQLALAAVLSVFAAMAAGFLPAWAASEAPGDHAARAAAGAGGDRRERRLQGVLVGSQFAVSLLLLAMAGWMTASLRAIETAATGGVGFDPQPLLTLRFYLPGDRYDEIGVRTDLHRRLLERVAASPGVAAAATTSALPADDGGDAVRVFADGQPVLAETAIPAALMSASPGFFDALGVPLVAGRRLTENEAADPQSGVALVSRALAARLWPAQAAVPAESIGRRFRMGVDPAAPTLEVIGVVPDLVYEEIMEQTPASAHAVFVGYARLGWRTNAMIVRAAAGHMPARPADLAAAVRAAIAAEEPDAPVYDLRPYAARLRQTYEDRTLLSDLFALFAAQTLALAAVGIAGMVGFAAARRTREIGVRMALGARRRDVVAHLAATGMRPLVVGGVVGLVAVLLVGRFLREIVYGVDTGDPRWGLAAALVLAIAGGFASFLPARRASAIEPSVALRAE